MYVEEFVHKTAKLLQIERKAEIDETGALIDNTPLKELQRRGICLLKLRISERKTGLYGRTVLTFAPYWDGKELPSHNFNPGDIAGISLSQGKTNESLASGIVSRVYPNSLSVALEEGQDDQIEELDDTANYKLVKLANDVTYTRLKKGLDNLNHYSSGPASELVNVLFGVSEPGPPYSQARDAENAPQIEFYNEGLDVTQQEAVRFALHQRELAIVHGPPGTGKTTTVIEIIRQAVKQKLKILACAPSNIAVDNLVERLGDSGTRIVRLGHPARLLPKIQRYALDALLAGSEEKALVKDVRSDMEKTLSKLKKARNFGERSSLRQEMKSLRKELRERDEAATRCILQRAQVVLSTLTGISDAGPLKLLEEQHFDLVIIDECSQALEAACWLALLKAPRCILAGDHNQLPPTIMSHQAAKEGLEITLMERLLKKYGDSVMRMLTVQYRMHEHIMKWASMKLYDNKLTAHDSVATHLLSDLDGVQETEDTQIPLLLIDTVGCGLNKLNLPSQVSKANEGEADIVAYHIDKLVESGLKPVDIAVIAPYNLQVELLRVRLSTKYPQLEIKSVDGFQGREKEAVVMCMVRSNPDGEVGFLAEQRRTNVAVTRARRHLAVVCDSETVGRNDFLQTLIDYIMERGEVRSAQQYIDDGALNNEYKRPDFLDEKIDNATTAAENASSKSTTNKNKGKRPESKTKGNVDNKNKENRSKEASDTRRHKFKPQKTEQELQEEAEEERELRVVFNEFLSDATRTQHDFPPSLSARQRFIAHNLAEEFGLKHASHGEGEERYMSVTKTSKVESIKKMTQSENDTNETETLVNNETKIDQTDQTIDLDTPCIQADVKVQEAKNHSNDKSNVNEKQATSSAAEAIKPVENKDKRKPIDCIDFSVCDHCKKEIPTCNISLHELRCSSNPNAKGARPKSAANEDTVNAKTKQKKKKKKANNTPAPKEEDFDALIAQATQMNTVCNFKKCKEFTTVLGQNCPFCAARFCLTHHIPESHGCGAAAKASARTLISKEGVLYRGSGVPDKKTDPSKRAHLLRKLDKKLGDMSGDRKIKKKTNEKS